MGRNDGNFGTYQRQRRRNVIGLKVGIFDKGGGGYEADVGLVGVAEDEADGEGQEDSEVQLSVDALVQGFLRVVSREIVSHGLAAERLLCLFDFDDIPLSGGFDFRGRHSSVWVRVQPCVRGWKRLLGTCRLHQRTSCLVLITSGGKWTFNLCGTQPPPGKLRLQICDGLAVVEKNTSTEVQHTRKVESYRVCNGNHGILDGTHSRPSDNWGASRDSN